MTAGAVTVSLSLAATAGAVARAGAAEQEKVGKFETGALTKVALENPECDPDTGRFRMQFYAAPPCVKEWTHGKDNGRATVQGVTRDAVKVVVLWNELPPDQIGTVGLFTNQATGKNEPDGARAALLDTNELFEHVYETWGRTVQYEFVRSSGADEASQRADAITVKAMKPFAVLDLASSIGTPGVGGGRVFQQTLVNEGVPYVTPRPTEPLTTSRALGLTTAEFVEKQLAGGRAEYADESMRSLPRKYGVLHSSNFEIDFMNAQFEMLGLPTPVSAEYAIPTTQSDTRTDAATIADVLPTLVTKLKTAGVTTLIMATNHSVAAAASREMAKQEWFPEVVLTSSPYQDLDFYGRTYDQRVWSHAFGLVWFPPYLKGAADPTMTAFQWFWGTDKGTRWSIAFFHLLGLYSVLQFVGPKLTEERVEPGVLARIFSQGVAAGGYYSDSIFTIEVRVAAPGKINPRGVAMAWWDPEATGPGNYNLGGDGKGKYVYLNEGRRFITGKLPKQKQPFFDRSASTVLYEEPPASEPVWPTYECVGCPSTGATALTPAAGQAG